MIATRISPIHEELRDFCRAARAPRVRTMRRFAEEELLIPEGRFQGERFRVHRQPWTGLWLDAIDSGLWNHYALLCCVQAGKSLMGFVLPGLYHLFELRETVILAAPTIDVCRDKWEQEIRPVFQQTRYAEFLPVRGKGSRGGMPEKIEFTHGPVLKFMSSGGGDVKRSSFTSRVVIMTETDKMDAASELSRETDPVGQLEARTLSYDETERVIYKECTVSIEQGEIWQSYQQGTASRIMCPCPHCGHWVCPEREDLRGWEGAESKPEARRLAAFVCPNCEKPWDDRQRREMNLAGRLVHRGQEIGPDGEIHGQPVETDTLGFRVNAFHNLFWPVGMIGGRAWQTAHGANEEAEERETLQFWWTTPWVPDDLDLTPLDSEKVKAHVDRQLPRGLVPEHHRVLTLGVDLHKWSAFYVVTSWSAEGAAHVVDYGLFDVPSDELPVDQATLQALRSFRDDLVATGWTRQGSGEPVLPQAVWIDSAWSESQQAVYAFCRESSPDRRTARYRPTRGYGATKFRDRVYRPPDKKGNTVRLIGEGYHVSRVPKDRIDLVHVSADHYKLRVQQGLSIPAGSPGATTIHYRTEREHSKFRSHMTSEIPREVARPGQPPRIVWDVRSRQNHYLDAFGLATAAGHFCGVRTVPGLHAAEAGSEPGERREWFSRRRKRRT